MKAPFDRRERGPSCQERAAADARPAGVTGKAGDFDIPTINGRRAFEEELRGGQAGRRRVIIDDLASVQPQASACLEALELALTHAPTAPGVTRAAVLISSPEQAALWDSAFEHGVAVALRRYAATTSRPCGSGRSRGRCSAMTSVCNDFGASPAGGRCSSSTPPPLLTARARRSPPPWTSSRRTSTARPVSATCSMVSVSPAIPT
ncbi:Uncharacterised protein [Amycolatopsis camponoti]|uniref:Uncharacterized protein n=1 Tax=Amycolatopsis camponoti TaxID=2606593 RepID=A0A6I8LMT5_9PSEU|nr:Uncharacterised protein [Amycolatopsis camponoti]